MNPQDPSGAQRASTPGLFPSDAAWARTRVLDARAIETCEFSLDEFGPYRRTRILTYSSSAQIGAAVDAFAAERGEVMAAWDELRERARDEGDTVALGPAFRETLDRHGALMKRAASFKARPHTFERLLAERAGIGRGEIEELEDVHARADSYLRSAVGRAAHAARRDPEREEAGVVEAITAGAAAPAAEPQVERHATLQPAKASAPDEERAATPDWRVRYKELQRDWNDLVARAEEPDLPLLLMHGYDELIGRVRDLAGHPGLSEKARNVLDELLEYHEDETVARETAEGFLDSAERHVEAYKALERQAGERGLPVARLDAWPEWRDAAEMLAATGKAVLSNDEKYGAYLDAVAAGKPRARLTVDQLNSRLRENWTRAPKTAVEQPRRERPPEREQGFAHRLDKPRQPGKQAGGGDEEQGIA